ncbi:MAG: prolyl oligopeptidase family serine peptidase [Candidatus Coatesbacteria bacterium]|nr:prolyl oligopeptidase family serine peptidase [Candidatus Coatesbacteria bacterium]
MNVKEMQVPLIPREVIFGNPARVQPRLSPDGRSMSYIAPRDGVLNIWLRELENGQERPLTNDTGRGIRRHFWSENGRYVIYLQDSDGDENNHLFRVDPTNPDDEPLDLTPFPGAKAVPALQSSDRPDELLVLLNKRDEALFDAYRLNTVSGELESAAENPGDIAEFLADWKLRVRLALRATPDAGNELLYREDEDGDWRVVSRWEYEDAHSAVYGFDADNIGVLLADPRGADTQRLIRLDPHSGKGEALLVDEGYDAHTHFGLLRDPQTHRTLAASVNRVKLEWRPLTDEVRDDLAKLEGRFPEAWLAVSDQSRDNNTWLVMVNEPRRAVSYYRYNRTDKSLSELFKVYPQLEDYELAEMKPVEFTARDGRRIEGYLSLPPGVEPAKLPLVLLVHGGPQARDDYGYDPMSQWLANRGYAVLQVNYRGSAGYGKAHRHAGNKEWGRRMQDDLTDACNWAVAEGLADPQRLCIMGGSYGGYAALAGLTFTKTAERPDIDDAPEDDYRFYRCAVSIVGPSNLATLLASIPPYWRTEVKKLHKMIGDPQTEAELIAERSPLNYAERIQTPLILAYGANDPRVKLAEGEQITAALKRADIPHEYHVYENEGHGFARPENRLDFFGKVEPFLAEHLGGRAQ